MPHVRDDGQGIDPVGAIDPIGYKPARLRSITVLVTSHVHVDPLVQNDFATFQFPVTFGRRRSTAGSLENVASAEPSFRVLDRTDIADKSFDGGTRLSAKTRHMPTTGVPDMDEKDNIFADLKTNRDVSITTKTTFTDNSSRHSSASTAPSSTGDVTAQRVSNQRPAPPQSKVMTPAQFERYRQDRERQDRERRDRHTYDDASETVRPDDEVDEDDINYDDDEDDAEKARQQAKQRRKQEAQMTLYRQQMMKVTGDAAVLPPSRPNLHLSSVSTPNLTPGSPSPGTGHSDHEDDDEESGRRVLQSSSNSDDDDELGWASMKAKRDNRKLAWKTQRGVGIGLGTLIH
ncbi:hypothetical protein P8C59_003334 [Phyllachora maydis]|uniref:Uncharacterized protein n=1 Tax=Phyllachora maydis TaxID=1825666 RepID=A0AAD9I075_9PEZI|nr:hypothetical protein P8C59_003334 [Phyllachora maydis]